MNENDRIPVEELTEHPFIADDLKTNSLSAMDIESFNSEMASKHYSAHSQAGASMMSNRFDDTEAKDSDVILTTKTTDQVRILLGQLVRAPTFVESNFDMSSSTYFNKHCDASIM